MRKIWYSTITDKKGGVVMKTRVRQLFLLLLVCALLVGCTSGAGGTVTTTNGATTTTVQQTTTTVQNTTRTTVTQPSKQLVAQGPTDLLAKITPRTVKDTAVDDKFAEAYLTFALNFFKNANAEDKGENVLVSPLRLACR